MMGFDYLEFLSIERKTIISIIISCFFDCLFFIYTKELPIKIIILLKSIIISLFKLLRAFQHYMKSKKKITEIEYEKIREYAERLLFKIRILALYLRMTNNDNRKKNELLGALREINASLNNILTN